MPQMPLVEVSNVLCRKDVKICVLFFHKISFGGTSGAGLQKSHSKRNFHGCLENVLYNDINMIDRAKEKQVTVTVSTICVNGIIELQAL